MSDFLVDQLLPSREVHIIAGPSGAGKTTWAFQTLVDWQQGLDILGFKSYPVPWVYVSSDRSLDSVKATLKRLNIPLDAFPKASAVDDGLHDINQVLKALSIVTPRPQMLYLDGMLNLLPPRVHPNDNRAVSGWLADMTRMCKKENITIIGSLHSPKMKKDEWYDNPRQRISGGASWAGFADTVILIEPVSPDDPSQMHHRRLLVLPRNHKEVVRNLAFNEHGRLVEVEEVLYDDLMFAFMITMKDGDTFSMDRVLTMFDGQISRPTIYKLLDKYLQAGVIERVSKGIYRKIGGVVSASA